MIKTIYVFGPIHLFGEDYLPFYKELTAFCAAYADRVIGTYPDFWDAKESPRAFYDRTAQTIASCDLMIAEVSSPSHGVGMELQMAQDRNIPVIALAKSDVDCSIMIQGIPNIRTIIFYDSMEDLLEKLTQELRVYKDMPSNT